VAVPSGQEEQLMAPTPAIWRAKLPALHCVQALLPVVLLAEPAGQGKQLSAPSVSV
jgi:hypothetical protein